MTSMIVHGVIVILCWPFRCVFACASTELYFWHYYTSYKEAMHSIHV